MTQYKSLIKKLSNSQLINLNSEIKDGTELTLTDFNGENNFPHSFLLTDRQISRFCKAFVNNSSANIKLSKAQLLKMVLLGEFIPYLDMLPSYRTV